MSDKADLCKEIGRRGAIIMQQEQAIAVLAEVAEALRQFTIADSDDVSMAKYKRLGARVKRAWRAAAKNPIAAQAMQEAKA